MKLLTLANPGLLRRICSKAVMPILFICMNEALASNESEKFKSYWYSGEAEITSYKLKQARYGELREGSAVLVYVTEPFLADKQVKADYDRPDNVSVLKLNTTKKFLTGLYPYSIMASTFHPVANKQHAIKVSTSTQEWCGNSFSQLNNRELFDIASYSYFEQDYDRQIKLEKTHLENELWTKLRIDPGSLPEGDFKIIPSLEYLRLRHRKIQAYDATASFSENNGIRTYTLRYRGIERQLEIYYEPAFPYQILGWEETYISGFGKEAKTMTSSAKKINTIKSDYWKKHGNKDLPLRKELGLPIN